MTTYAIYVTEACLLRLLFLVATGKRPVILGVRAFLPGTHRLLNRVVRYLIDAGKVVHVADLCPRLKPHWAWDMNLYFEDIPAKYEDWLEDHFRFAEARDPIYGYAYKHVISETVYRQAVSAVSARTLVAERPDDTVIFAGLPDNIVGIHHAVYGHFPPDTQPAGSYRINVLVNLALSMLIVIYGLGWILRRIRREQPPRQVFCIFDSLNNSQERHLVAELADGGDIIVMNRGHSLGVELELATQDGWPTCIWGEGRFGPRGAFAAAALVCRDVARLFGRHAWLSPDLFAKVAKLPIKKLGWRALFNLYQPRCYLGRDEYNSDHILRRHEMHRFGGLSFGLSGGNYAAFAKVAPNARYLAFDHHFVLGHALFDNYKPKWAEDMKVSSIGCWGFSRSDLVAGFPKGDAILVAVRMAFDRPVMQQMIAALARSFPDRRIILHMKKVTFDPNMTRIRFGTDTEGVNAAEWLSQGLENVELRGGPIYPLMKEAALMVSDVSTVVAEGIQIGLPTYFADVLDQETSIYRELPGVSHSKPETLTASATAALAKPETFDSTGLRRQMGISPGIIAFDIIREAMGLPSKSTKSRHTASLRN